MKQSKESKAQVAALRNVSDPQRWTPKSTPQPAPVKPEAIKPAETKKEKT